MVEKKHMRTHRARHLVSVVAAAVLAFAACSKQESGLQTLVRISVDPFTFTTEGIDNEQMQNKLSADTMAWITVAVYDADAGQLVYHESQQKSAQASSGAHYGDVEMRLHAGNYIVQALAYNSSEEIELLSQQSARFAGIKSDCHVGTKAVAVTGSGTVDISMHLNRIVAKFGMRMWGPIPDSVASMELAFSGGDGLFNPANGNLTVDTAFVYSTTVSSIVRAMDSVTLYALTLLTGQTQTMDITARARNAQGQLLFERTFENVRLERNKSTLARGDFFSATAEGNFSVDLDYEEGEVINF
ncbi:MAG: hypothetical protein IJ684_03565 [Bacteroidales bacterium]|nr:hypothetical protein [Bacteroidales bacterium]